jgi:hypothetical protein
MVALTQSICAAVADAAADVSKVSRARVRVRQGVSPK